MEKRKRKGGEKEEERYRNGRKVKGGKENKSGKGVE